METIEFKYCFKDGNNDCQEVRTIKRDENGLHDYDICEMFEDFMRAVGFSERSIMKYFKE